MVDQDAFTIGANTVVNTVELNNNNLTKLDMKKAKVKKLYVFNNTLEEIFLSPWMESVIAYDNNISSILLDNTSSKSLKTLHLNNNSITSIESIQHLDSLENLILSNNRIDTVNLTSFAKFTNLEKLELKQNFISNLQLGTFAQQESLKWIDLSYNNLDQFDFDILSSSTVLERIYLDGNRLKSMNHQFLKEKFPSLKEIGLTDNSWDCTYLIQLAWYCKKHSIGLITYHSAVGYTTNHTNVEGILCYDDDNPLTNGNITMHPHDHNFESEDNTLHTLLRNVNENMRRFNDRHEYEANQTNKLDSNVYELANNHAELQKELSSLRQSLMKIQLTL
uniref:Leucine rich immune protein (Short) n=1 Tax=Anopheles minimus TaxID=112268 RepID=A0A182VVF2_9DIPT